jgi:GTPase SAR1 family protein
MEIVVVGPCGSGKSTLVTALTQHGYTARAVAQEHSAVPTLWQHGGTPAVLVYLEAERGTISRRRGADFPAWLLRQQRRRLASARVHADLVIQTDQATPGQVLARVLDHVRRAGILKAPGR